MKIKKISPSTEFDIELIIYTYRHYRGDTRKYHEFIDAYCYECEAQVTMPEAMSEWCFHGIALYTDNKGFIVCKPERLLAKLTLSNKRFP